ncbi:MAG: hypothetical protein FJ290_33175, partial [Planctomycetes bacterium]|nr:hypothetical protein [Planctomycetota bacterium]
MMERAFPLATALGVVWLSVCGVGAPPGHAKGDALLAIGPRGPTGADTPLSEAEKAQFAQRVTIAGGTAAEVQAACDRAAKEGVPVVFFPAGEYVFEAEVRVPGDLTLLGDGSKTLIRTRDRNSRLFSAAGDRVRFTRLKLQGADTTLNESNDTYGITISRAQNCRIDHCELLGFSYATTPREECTAQIDHCYIHHNLREGLGYGTSIYSGAYVLITDNEFEQNRHSLASNGTLDWSSPKHAGKYLHKPGRKTHWEFVHNRVRGNDLSRYELCAVDTHPGMDGTFVVEWNLFENLRHGVGIRDGSGVIRHNVFRNLRTVTKFRPLVAVSITYGLHNNVPVDGCMPRDITVEGNVCLMPEGVKFEKCQVGKAENIVVEGELVPATKVERPAPSPLPLLTPMDADGNLGIGQRDPVSRPAKTTKVTGQILDESGKAVDSATVHIGSKSAATDANGHFAVDGLAERRHVVAITKPGFEDALLSVTT